MVKTGSSYLSQSELPVDVRPGRPIEDQWHRGRVAERQDRTSSRCRGRRGDHDTGRERGDPNGALRIEAMRTAGIALAAGLAMFQAAERTACRPGASGTCSRSGAGARGCLARQQSRRGTAGTVRLRRGGKVFPGGASGRAESLARPAQSGDCVVLRRPHSRRGGGGAGRCRAPAGHSRRTLRARPGLEGRGSPRRSGRRVRARAAARSGRCRNQDPSRSDSSSAAAVRRKRSGCFRTR